MASSRSPDIDQAGPFYVPSEPLPGTFLGLALDLRSEKLYDLTPDIPDVMGLRALRPSAAIVKQSVPDSRCIRVVTPDDHVNIGFHEILLHDMEEEELPFVATSELDYLRRVWPKTLFVFMSRYQQDLERLRKECKERFGTVRIVESISSGIWASTLPSTTWNSRSCGVVRLCGARCGREPLRTVLITCGGLIMSRCR